MRHVRNIFMAVLSGVLMLVVAVTAPSAHADTPAAAQAPHSAAMAWDDQTGEALPAWDCNLGNVCFWNSFDGTGGRCMWDVADPDWTSGSATCSWATSRAVMSVYNRGTSSGLTGVVYYRNTGYNTRAGCTRQGQHGNLAGTYQLRSHQWTNGSCG